MSEQGVVQGFTWKDKPVRSLKDLVEAVAALESREEAQEFMAAYSRFTPYAYQNIGYVAGYFTQEDADRIYDWCQTSHPIFGRRHPTPEEAFDAGRRMMNGGQS